MNAEQNMGDEVAIHCAWCGAEEMEFLRNGKTYETGPRGEIYVTGRDQETHNYFDALSMAAGKWAMVAEQNCTTRDEWPA